MVEKVKKRYAERVVEEFLLQGGIWSGKNLGIYEDGGANIRGVEMGPVVVHERTTNVIVLKELGHTWYWNQYQGQKYEATKFIVFERVKDTQATLRFVVDFYLKAKKGG